MRVERHGGDGLREQPTGALVRDFIDEGQTLLREEVRLVKAEIREEAAKAARGGAAMGAGGAVLYAAVLLLGGTLVLIGAMFLPAWLSALIVTAIYAIAGGIALGWGKRKLEETNPARPVEELEEGGKWAKETMRDIRSSRRARE
jgi:uncharacterized membrane protein YqjE